MQWNYIVLLIFLWTLPTPRRRWVLKSICVFSTNPKRKKILNATTTELMTKWEFPHTRLHAMVYRGDTSIAPERSKQFGIGSTTAEEMVRLCESLYKKELVSPEASAAMLKHMEACDDKDKFPRFLPPGTKVAFKTGSLDAAKTAAGIITTPGGPVAVCVLTDENEDKRWVTDNAGNRLCADVARAIFDHFQTQGEPKPTADPAKP